MKRFEPYVTWMVGVILSLLSWSLSENVKEFRTKLDSVASDMRSVGALAQAHTTQIAVIDHRISQVELRLTGLEDRERKEHTTIEKK